MMELLCLIAFITYNLDPIFKLECERHQKAYSKEWFPIFVCAYTVYIKSEKQIVVDALCQIKN